LIRPSDEAVEISTDFWRLSELEAACGLPFELRNEIIMIYIE
jgi:hypothetical protein